MRDTQKRERFIGALAHSDFDLVVAVSPENTWYLSEAVIDTQRTLLERLALVAWPKQGEPVYILDENPTAENIARLIFEHAAAAGLPVVEVVLWETENCHAAYRR